MNRRNFLNKSTLTGASLLALGTQSANASNRLPAETPFKLNFAPHEGTFKNNGGTDFVDQIKYMHDMGFRSIEDNGMLKRPRDVQDKIGNTLAKLGMTMGVFVVDGGDNWKVSYTTGGKDFTDKFVQTCKDSV